PRQGKAPGRILHTREGALVDVDDDDIRVGREARGVPSDEGVEQAVLERLQAVREKHFERREPERGGGEGSEEALHRRSASTPASAWNRSTDASISSRTMETLSTLTPSGISRAQSCARMRRRFSRQMSIDLASGCGAPRIARWVSSAMRTPSHRRNAMVFSRPTGANVSTTRRGA